MQSEGLLSDEEFHKMEFAYRQYLSLC